MGEAQSTPYSRDRKCKDQQLFITLLGNVFVGLLGQEMNKNHSDYGSFLYAYI